MYVSTAYYVSVLIIACLWVSQCVYMGALCMFLCIFVCVGWIVGMVVTVCLFFVQCIFSSQVLGTLFKFGEQVSFQADAICSK